MALYDPPALDLNSPFVTEGLRRRAVPAWDAPAPDPTFNTDPTSGFGKRVRSANENFKAGLAATLGLGEQLVGAQDSALENYQAAQGFQRRAAEIGPEVQSWQDVADRGYSPDSIGEYAATTAINTVPDLALSLIGGALGGNFEAGLARRGLVKLAERNALKIAESMPVRALSEDVVRKQGTDAAIRLATRETADAIAPAEFNQLLTQGGSEALRKATIKGQFLGSSAGEFPSTVGQSADELSKTDQEGAAKIAIGDALAAGAGSVGTLALLRHAGVGALGEAAKAEIAGNAEHFLPKLLKGAAKDALTEGSTEVAQQAIQLAGHKWVNDNVDLLGPDAMNQYLESFVGGALLGGGFGGATELKHAATERAGPLYDKLRTTIRDSLSTYGAKAREAFDKANPFTAAPPAEGEAPPAKPKPGEPMSSAPVEDVNTTFGKALDALKGGAGTAKDSILGAFDKIKSKLKFDLDSSENLDNRTNAVIDQFASQIGEQDTALRGLNTTRAGLRFETPWQSAIMNTIPVDTLATLRDQFGKEKLQDIATATEKLFTGEKMSEDDHRLINAMDGFAFPPGTVDKWRMITSLPDFQKTRDEIKRLGGKQETATAQPDNPAVADELQQALAAREAPAQGEAAAPNPTLTGIGEAGVEQRPALERLADLPLDHPDREAVRQQAERDLLKPDAGSASNLFTEQPGKEAAFDAKLAQPGSLLRATTDGPRQIVDFGGLIRQAQGQDSTLDLHSAALTALANMKLAGVR